MLAADVNTEAARSGLLASVLCARIDLFGADESWNRHEMMTGMRVWSGSATGNHGSRDKAAGGWKAYGILTIPRLTRSKVG